MSTSYLAFTGTPGEDNFIASHMPHGMSLSAAIEFFQNNPETADCVVARIPASTKNITSNHYIWEDISEGASDTEEVTRSHVIDAIKNGRYHSAHAEQRSRNLETSYDKVMRFKGRAVYYALLVLFLLLLSVFLPTGYFEIYLIPIVAVYAAWIGISYYIVHLGCRGWAREFNPVAEDAETLIKELTI